MPTFLATLWRPCGSPSGSGAAKVGTAGTAGTATKGFGANLLRRSRRSVAETREKERRTRRRVTAACLYLRHPGRSRGRSRCGPVRAASGINLTLTQWVSSGQQQRSQRSAPAGRGARGGEGGRRYRLGGYYNLLHARVSAPPRPDSPPSPRLPHAERAASIATFSKLDPDRRQLRISFSFSRAHFPSRSFFPHVVTTCVAVCTRSWPSVWHPLTDARAGEQARLRGRVMGVTPPGS